MLGGWRSVAVDLGFEDEAELVDLVRDKRACDPLPVNFD